MPAITDDYNYEICCTDRLKELDHSLQQELTDLKNELEENEMVHGISRAVRLALNSAHSTKFEKQLI